MMALKCLTVFPFVVNFRLGKQWMLGTYFYTYPMNSCPLVHAIYPHGISFPRQCHWIRYISQTHGYRLFQHGHLLVEQDLNNQ